MLLRFFLHHLVQRDHLNVNSTTL